MVRVGPGFWKYIQFKLTNYSIQIDDLYYDDKKRNKKNPKKQHQQENIEFDNLINR